MAENPAFLFYPGDASEDTQFMNRLERGCYFDLLKAQKKFVRFTIEQIKKVLGKDFIECWASLEIILKRDDKGYFIGWADDAISKREKFKFHQSENGKKGGRPVKKGNPMESQIKPNDNPRDNFGLNKKKPLGNEIENGNEIEDENDKGGTGETFLIPEMLKTWLEVFPNYPTDNMKDYPALGKLSNFICEKENMQNHHENKELLPIVLSRWKSIAEYCKQDKFYAQYNISQVEKYIQSIIQKIQNVGTKGNNKAESGFNADLKRDLLNRMANRPGTG